MANGDWTTPPRPSLAAQVCSACKARKKKCDKVLPRCDYCIRKGLSCGYDYDIPLLKGRSHDIPASTIVGGKAFDDLPVDFPSQRKKSRPYDGTVSSQPFPSSIPAEPFASSQANLYLQIHGLIRQTGQYVDDVSARYFQSIHRYFPMISRARFHDNLITLGGTPPAGFSILLLAICLTTSSPELERRVRTTTDIKRQIDRRSLYLAARSLFAQAQASFSPSVHLIQAGLLLAIYEYVIGRPDEAFTSIAACARMAYATRIHLCSCALPPWPWTSMLSADADIHLKLQAHEAANTWWGVIICERTFFCDVTTAEQPLLTVILGGDARLPTEASTLEQSGLLDPESVSYVPVSCLSTTDAGGFARAAQASWLLDQVLKSFEFGSLDLKLNQLQGLDASLQSFLGTLMQQCSGKGGAFCEAIAISIRAIFALHWHMLSQPSQTIIDSPHSSSDWCKQSLAALNTATKMVLDIVEIYENSDPYLFTSMTPSYSYLVRAALKHIYSRTEWKDNSWLHGAEEKLRKALDHFTSV